jgi:hypothetical protein
MGKKTMPSAKPAKINMPKSATKGQKTGASTYKTAQIRSSMRLFQNQNFQVFVDEWKKIENPTEKVRLYLDSLNYTVGRVAAVDLTSDKEKTTLEETLIKLISENIDDSE